MCSFPGVQKPVEQYGCTVNGAAATKDDEDDDFDLFGSDDEDDVSICSYVTSTSDVAGV